MQVPVQITFRNMDPSDAVRGEIERKIAKLERFNSHITACQVIVDLPHRRHHQGRLFHVAVNIDVPGEEICINREPELNHAHEDLHVALRDAFDRAKRQLEGYVKRKRGDIKQHASPVLP